jgi:hypothetical protein
MAKDRQKRMAQTLGCLVASMTACALVLHLGQPKPDRPAVPPAIELIASVINQPWHYIRIDPAPADGQIDRQAHFFVDREGRWSATDTWRSQARLGQKGVVQIALQPSAHTNKITPAQWETTRRLMRVLLDQCNIPDRHIVLNDALAIPVASRKAAGASPRPSVGQMELARPR